MTGNKELALTSLMEQLRPLLMAEAVPVYLVGGTVRDALLGRPIHDLDLIVPSGAISLTFRLADARGYRRVYALDAERDVGRILPEGEGLTLDIARFRGPTLADDLRDRDFTINAMALPVGEHTAADVIDYHNGLNDLEARRIRVIHDRSIENDPVRALRAARFAVQLGFELTAETQAAARAAAPILLQRTSAERIRDELSRLLTLDAPHRGIELLDELGLLSVVLPEVAALDGIIQSPPHHEDVLHHTMSVLRYLAQVEQLVDGRPLATEWSEDVERLIAPHHEKLRRHLDTPVDGGFPGRLLLRWGGLFHDTGKAATRTVDVNGRIRFFGHDEVGARIASAKLSSLGFSNEAVRRVRHIVDGHMRPLHLAMDIRPPSRRTVYRYFKALHEAGLDVGLLTLADHLATYDGIGDEESWESLLVVVRSLFDTYFGDYEQTVSPPRLLTGRDLMDLLDIPPGHEIGRLLRLLEEAQAAGEVSTRDEAIAFVRRHAGM